jgi:hypothetical protein
MHASSRAPLNKSLDCMNAGDHGARGAPTSAAGYGAASRIRMVLSILKRTVLAAFGLIAVLIILGVGGVRLPFWFRSTDVSHEKPYADFVGREYRVTGQVSALAWNAFPDKAKILNVSLMPSPGARNRFVSYSIPLQPGQRVRIISAWRQFALVEFTYRYVVNVPGAGLPEAIPITMKVSADGVPDPLIYEPIDKAVR